MNSDTLAGRAGTIAARFGWFKALILILLSCALAACGHTSAMLDATLRDAQDDFVGSASDFDKAIDELQCNKYLLLRSPNATAQQLREMGPCSMLFMAAGRYEAALNLRLTRVTTFANRLPSNHIALAFERLQLANLQLQVGDVDAALATTNKLYSATKNGAVTDQPLPPTYSPERLVVGTSILFGAIENRRRKYREAYKFLSRAWDLHAQLPSNEGEAALVIELAIAEIGTGKAKSARERISAAKSKFLTDKTASYLPLAKVDELIGLSYLVEGRHQDAIAALQKSTAVFAQAINRTAVTAQEYDELRERSERSQHAASFSALIVAAHKAYQSNPAKETVELALDAAQHLADSVVSSSIRRSALARTAPEALQSLSRQQQDAHRDFHAAYRRLFSAKDSAAEFSTILASHSKKISDINTKIASTSPRMAIAGVVQPISMASLQSTLRDDESLIISSFIELGDLAPDQLHVWVVSPRNVSWHRTEISKADLERKIRRHRCGLDAALASCGAGLTMFPGSDDIRVPQFDAANAFELYKLYFTNASSPRLIVVGSGHLSTLPLNSLIQAPPAFGRPRTTQEFRSLNWLGLKKVISVVPSASSVVELRNAPQSKASSAYIGFGNPILSGTPGNLRHASDHAASLRRQSCASHAAPTAIGLLSRSGSVERSNVLHQPPLPDTADEICSVATTFGTSESAVIGHQFTKSRFLEMNATRRLLSYRVVHFASHALSTSKTEGMPQADEPAIVVTPVNGKAESALLKASEIVKLHLDTDLVVLSACNTSAPGPYNSEHLSGLARAFIVAGTRALIVSNWYVDSFATKTLVTDALQKVAVAKADGAVAMQNAMIKLALNSEDVASHPTFWAGFMFVGVSR